MSVKQFGIRMEQNIPGNAKMMKHILRSLRKEKKNLLNNIKDNEGKIITEENKITERLKEYYEQILNGGQRGLQEETEVITTMKEEQEGEKNQNQKSMKK